MNMKLYMFPPAPNPARVLAYIREKGLDIELVLVDFFKGEQRSAEHLARSPAGVVPVLELADGTCLTESLPIMEYLEELYPEPPLIGTDALSRAQTRVAERDIELNVLQPIGRYVHATNSPLKQPPNPALAAYELERLPSGLNRVNERLAGNEFVMGERPTIADCTLLGAVNFGNAWGYEIEPRYSNLLDWFNRFALRHL